MEVRTYLSVSSHGSISSDHQQVWLRYWTLSCYRLVSAGGQAVISYQPGGNVTWYDPSAHSFLNPPPPSHLRQSWPLFHIGFASCQSQFPAHFNFTEEKKPLDCVTNHPWIFNGLLRQLVNQCASEALWKPRTLAARGELVVRVSSVEAARRRQISAESAYRVRSVCAPPLRSPLAVR